MIILISLRYDKFSENQLEKWIFLTNFAENNELSRQISIVSGERQLLRLKLVTETEN